MDAGTKRISFVIRTRNEERWIGHAIQSVIDHFGAKTEIVIVDNNSTDETLQIVSLFNQRYYNVSVYQLEDLYTPGKSLNFGISKTNGGADHIVGILSAHSQIVKIDPKLLFGAFDADEDCFGIMGKQTPIYKGKRIHSRYLWENFMHPETVRNPLELIKDEERYFFHNAFSFIKRSIWQKHPFDEDLAGKEDRYWANKLVNEYGKFFLFEPKFEVKHYWTAHGATWTGIG